jgi:hypothetical protein
MIRPVEARARHRAGPLGFGGKPKFRLMPQLAFRFCHTPQLLARGRRALSRSNSKEVSGRDLTHTICELFLYKALMNPLWSIRRTNDGRRLGQHASVLLDGLSHLRRQRLLGVAQVVGHLQVQNSGDVLKNVPSRIAVSP